MTDWLSRTELLLGTENLLKLQSKHVLVVGLGGVGAYAAEQICRAGVGEMTIVDADVIEDQYQSPIDCAHNTVGQAKLIF